MAILVTGGAGYIGSHTLLVLCEAGYEVVVIDNLVNGSVEAIKRVNNLANSEVAFVHGDISDEILLERVLSDHEIDAVIHFAALKAVGESILEPLAYYKNNVLGTVKLLDVLDRHDIRKFVFSSSATVYGQNTKVPYFENYGRGCCSNPYGATKGMVEQILEDLAASNDEWSIVNLRYFNPIGAHSSGEIGEDPLGIPNNLIPYISQVAVGRREKLSVFGSDYPTQDGTCRRDYLHVMDLAYGHLAALENLSLGCEAYNLGTGKPLSVLEIVHAFEAASGQSIPFEIVERRAGDLAEFWADITKAKKELNWSSTRSVEDMMIDTWNWQSKYPKGYGK